MKHQAFKLVKTVNGVTEYELKKNGLRVLYRRFPDTGVVTTGVLYRIGSKDEQAGESGIAHMLEHMLFKPTKADKANKLKNSSAMLFDSEVGALTNANTWLDRTFYYFSLPTTYLERALRLESERMQGVVLENKSFLPERGNVLSEFDMYNGMPAFALEMAMLGAAFNYHPYGREVIGSRADIEHFTVEKLQRYYDHYYKPNNAVVVVFGDADEKTTLDLVSECFSHLERENGVEVRPEIIEPKQEGLRRTTVARPGVVNLLSFGFRHAGFPGDDWFKVLVILNLLAGDNDSWLKKELVDKGFVTKVGFSIAPAKDENFSMIQITLSDKLNHQAVEEKVLDLIKNLDYTWVKKQLKTIIARVEADNAQNEDSSLGLASELAEYLSAGDWARYYEIEKILQSIKVSDIKSLVEQLFAENNLVIGQYKSI